MPARASVSQREQLAEHRQTALELLDRILRPGDQAFVISVDSEVRVWADLTAAPADLRKQFAGRPGDLFGQPCPKSPQSAGSQTNPGVRLQSPVERGLRCSPAQAAPAYREQGFVDSHRRIRQRKRTHLASGRRRGAQGRHHGVCNSISERIRRKVCAGSVPARGRGRTRFLQRTAR